MHRVLMGVAMGICLLPSAAARHQTSVTCLPTCASADGRFLVVAGAGEATMVTSELVAVLEASADSSSVRIGLFDGDATPATTAGRPEPHWDVMRNNRPAPGLTLRLSADATGREVVRQWSAAQSALEDNTWTDLVVAHDPRARWDGGYRYWLTISAESADPGWNTFKLRSDARLTLPTQSVSFLASMTPPVVNRADATIIYPNFPDRAATTYDGSWTWPFILAGASSSLEVWDGDWDFGDAECEVMDTDDPDSPRSPPFDRVGAVDQGVARGVEAAAGHCLEGRPTGDPPEDGLNVNFRRVPKSMVKAGIAYAIVAPDGTRWVNTNPSGNQEWEKFHVSAPLPAGLYRLIADGVDLLNLNLIRLPYPILATDTPGL